mmetsp:Transcript_24092/g.37817  ORF Transcript_24092/g.37817 Transcript_24092/m.37817 type:complete len:184 (+) Transcript_24092:33-584(+)
MNIFSSLKSGVAKEVWAQFSAIFQFTCLLHCFHEHVLDVTICIGPSMLPTFNTEGDVVLVEFFSTRLQKLKSGDVVVAKSPTNPKQTVCKRICGMPGDIVQVAPSHSFAAARHHVVPEGHVWLQGDNLANSTDSRAYGAVPIALIRGRVFYKIWPINEAGKVDSITPASVSPSEPREPVPRAA